MWPFKRWGCRLFGHRVRFGVFDRETLTHDLVCMRCGQRTAGPDALRVKVEADNRRQQDIPPEKPYLVKNPYLAITPCPICEVWGDRNHADDCPNR